MRVYISPIGYDTRRVTRPVVNAGLSPADSVHLLRPNQEADTERAMQAVTDVEQLLQEIEPNITCTVSRITTDPYEDTVRQCCNYIESVSGDNETIVSLGGGARDILLPLTIAAIVLSDTIDRTLFFSDLDGIVHEWDLPNLTAQIPTRTSDTFEVIVDTGKWISLSELAEQTGQSKSTVIRHVQDLEAAGVIESDSQEKSKRTQISFSGELRWIASHGN